MKKRDLEARWRVGKLLTFPILGAMRRSARAHRLGRGPSFPITVWPLEVDVAIARPRAPNNGPAPEEIAPAQARGADEKVIFVLG